MQKHGKFKSFSADEQAATAHRYHESGLTQAEFCKEEDICPRTLRNWIRKFAPSERSKPYSVANVNALIRGLYQAAEGLQNSLESVEDRTVRISVTATVTTAQYKYLAGLAKIQDTNIQRVLRDIIDDHLDRTILKAQTHKKSTQRKHK